MENKTSTIHTAAEYFDKHNYISCTDFIEKQVCDLLYTHVKLNSQRLLFSLLGSVILFGLFGIYGVNVTFHKIKRNLN